MSSLRFSRPFTFDRVVRLLLTTVSVFLAVWLIYVLRGVLLPFGVSVLIAYMLEPFVRHNKRLLRLKGRTVAVFVTLFEAVFLFGVRGYFILPSVIEEMRQVGAMISLYTSSEQEIAFLPDGVHSFLKNHLNLEYISAMLSGRDWLNIGSMAMRIVGSGIGLILNVFNWLLVFLYVVFIMIDYDRLGAGVRAMVPPQFRRRAFLIGRDIKTSMNHYFRGQALVAFCVGVLFCIGFLIMGLPLAVLLGLFIGVLNMVPYLQLISIPITAVLCLIYSVDSGASFWMVFWEAMAVYVIVQAIQDLFLTPKIMGKAMGLNPAIILLSLSVWGTLLGLLGMIIALPLTTLILSYYERFVLRRYDARSVERISDFPSEKESR